MNDDLRLRPQPNKLYKVFLVEDDDDERERVIAGQARLGTIQYDPHYDEVHVDHLLDSAKIFKTHTEVTMTLDLVPSDDGTYFRIEDFSREELTEADNEEYDVPNEWETYE